jgi:hypothetical protein
VARVIFNSLEDAGRERIEREVLDAVCADPASAGWVVSIIQFLVLPGFSVMIECPEGRVLALTFASPEEPIRERLRAAFSSRDVPWDRIISLPPPPPPADLT